MAVQELEDYFNNIELPKEVSLHPAIKIIDAPKFVETQLLQIKEHGVKSPAYSRLMELKKVLENGGIE